MIIMKPLQSCFQRSKKYNYRSSSNNQIKASSSTLEHLNWKNQSEDTYKSLSTCNIVTFNMLAPCYKRTFFRSVRSRESSETNKWFIRAQQTVQFLQQEICSTATIVALQEFWLQEEYYSIFRHIFEKEGFEVRYLRRTGSKTDSVALLIRKNIFEILGSENINLCGQNDRVALLLWLQHKSTGRYFIVVNTHLSFPHSVFDKMAQVRQMQTVTEAIDRFALRYHISTSTRIILGDFNVENQSPVCDHLRVSGYSSCFDVSPPVVAESSKSSSVHIEKENIGLPESYFDDTTPHTAFPSSSYGNSSDFTHDQEHNSEYQIYGAHGSISTNKEATSPQSSSSSSASSETESKINETTHAIPFDSHAAFVQSRLEMLRQTRLQRMRPSFVSHFNHRQEEVGVDHIFILPEAVLDPKAFKGKYSSVSSVGLLSKSESDTSNSEAVNGVIKRTVISANAYYTGNTSSSKGTKDEKNSISQSMNYVSMSHGTNHYSNHHGREVSDACLLPDNRDNFTRPGLEDVRDDELFEQSVVSEDNNIVGLNDSNGSSDKSSNSSDNGASISKMNVGVSDSETVDLSNEKIKFENIKPSSIFVAQCHVLPTSLTSKVWHPEFQISDHRPISATFVIAENIK